MMLRKSKSPYNPLAFTLLLGAGTIFACGGSNSPEPEDGWQEDACALGLISQETCDGLLPDEMPVMPMPPEMPMPGVMPMPAGPPCDAPETIFKTVGGNGCSGGSCHNTGSFFGAFADEPAADFLGDGTAGCDFIDTTNPADSKIYARLSGEGPCAGASFMPLGATERYADADLECVLSWVSQFSDNPPVAAPPPPPPADEVDPPGDVVEVCDAVEDVFKLPGAQGGCSGGGGCHDGGLPTTLTGDVAFASYFGEGDCSKTIDTANAVDSTIYGRMTGEGACAGNPMPFLLDPSSDEQKACVLSWLGQFDGLEGN